MALCSICNHPNRAAIDKALVTRSASMRDVAGQYGVSRSALSRHKTNHLPRLVQAAEVAEAAQAVTSGAALIDELDRLLKKALAILEAAEKAGELKVALQALREAGRRVPDDVRVVGFDDSALALQSDPALTTMTNPASLLASEAARLLIGLLSGERPGSPVFLTSELVVRDSA